MRSGHWPERESHGRIGGDDKAAPLVHGLPLLASVQLKPVGCGIVSSPVQQGSEAFSAKALPARHAW